MVSSSEFVLVVGEWEYEFALQIIEHYSSIVWLPSLVMLLQSIGRQNFSRDLFMELMLALHFISQKLQDLELSSNINTGENSDNIQVLDLYHFDVNSLDEDVVLQAVFIWFCI